MSDIQNRIENYLEEEAKNDEYLPEEDIKIMERMADFIMDLDSDNLTESQIEKIMDLFDELSESNIDDLFEEDIDEAFTAKKVKIKPSDTRKRRREYRKHRAALKLKAKKYRRTPKFKQWKRKSKRKAAQGKTATGKRIRKFL